MRTRMITLCVMAAVLGTAATVVSATFMDDMYAYLPSTRMEPGAITAFGSTWVRNFTVNNITPNPVIEDDVRIQSFFDIFLEVSTDSGGNWLGLCGTGDIDATPDFQGLVDWEYLVVGMNSSTNPTGLMLRESPTLSSTGHNTYVPVTGGYMIDSFFDVFLECSLDGGNTWMPTTGISVNCGQQWTTGTVQTHVVGVPEPASMMMLGTSMLGLLAYAWRYRQS